jgi:hypothetical protein
MAAAKLRVVDPNSHRDASVLPDGSLVVTAQQLARFGDGDANQGRRELRLLLAADRQGPVFNGPATLPASIRIAGPRDEAALMALLALDLAENAAHIAPVDDAKVLANIQVGTRQRGGVAGVIDGPDGSPVAVILLHPVQWWWSQGWYWFEVVNFVHPDHRRSRHVDDLLAFAKWFADTHSKRAGYLVYLLCGVLGAWRVRAKVALYRRKFVQAGAAFVYPSPFAKD